MRYTYRTERFFYDYKTDIGMLFGVVITSLSMMYLVKVKPDAEMDASVSTYIINLGILVIGLCFLLINIIRAWKRRRRVIHNHLEIIKNGQKSLGKVINAGGRFHLITKNSGLREGPKRNTYHFFRSNWWIEIIYDDAVTGIPKTMKVENMNKNGKLHRIIGKAVEVYNHHDSIYVKVMK